MVSINKITLMGNVGADPEIHQFTDGTIAARFKIATNESYTAKNGERVTNTEWHPVVVRRNLARVVEQYIRKGSEILVEGKLTHRSYEKNGETKYITEVEVTELQLGRKRTNTEGDGENQTTDTATVTKGESAKSYESAEKMPDDLPF